MPRKRRNDDDDGAVPNINSSSSSSFSTSSSLVRDCLTADIDASTAKYLLELKANREQAAMARAAELEAIKQKEHDLTLQSEREKLRHQQKLAENQQAQHELIEKAEDDLLFQSKAKVARKALSSRQKRLDWAHETEKDDYAEKQRRDAQEWEDRRQSKLKRLKKVEEREDARLQQEEQDTISRQTYEREMNKVVVMDNLRKGKVGEKTTSDMVQSIFIEQAPPRKRKGPQKGKVPQTGEESEIEGSEEEQEAIPYKPYDPFGESA